MRNKSALHIIFSIINIVINGFILLMNFLLSSKESDYYASWNVPYAWLTLTPTIFMGVVFIGGVIWLTVKRRMWAQLPIAAPLIFVLLFSFMTDSFLKTRAMRELDERNRKHIECIVQFQREHPDEDSTGVCPF